MGLIDIVLGINTGKVQTGLRQVRQQMGELKSEFGKSFAEILGAAGVGEAVKQVIEYGAEVQNLSKRFGVAASTLQVFTNAAKVNGGSIESVAQAMNKLTVNQEKAINGSKEQKEAFDRLGITSQQLTTLAPDKLFLKISDAVAHAKDQSQAYADVITLMGRSSGELFATLQGGSAKILELGNAAGTMSDETVESLHKIEHAMTAIKTVGLNALGYVIAKLEVFGEVVSTVIAIAVGQFGVLIATLEGKFARAKEIMDNIHNLKFIDPKSSEETPRAVDTERDEKLSSEEKEKLKEKAKLTKELADLEFKEKLKGLSVEKQITELVAKRTKLLAEAAQATDDNQKLQLQIEAQKLQDEINADKKEEGKDDLKLAKEAGNVKVSTGNDALDIALQQNKTNVDAAKAEQDKQDAAASAAKEKSSEEEKAKKSESTKLTSRRTTQFNNRSVNANQFGFQMPGFGPQSQAAGAATQVTSELKTANATLNAIRDILSGQSTTSSSPKLK